MTGILVCWRCGAPLEGLPLPLGRSAECMACGAQLHVCRLCEFYDPRVAKSCREPMAEEVMDKERANFCEYFQAKFGAYIVRDDSPSRAARVQLEALFGGGTEKGAAPSAPDNRKALERLFNPAKKRGD